MSSGEKRETLHGTRFVRIIRTGLEVQTMEEQKKWHLLRGAGFVWTFLLILANLLWIRLMYTFEGSIWNITGLWHAFYLMMLLLGAKNFFLQQLQVKLTRWLIVIVGLDLFVSLYVIYEWGACHDSHAYGIWMLLLPGKAVTVCILIAAAMGERKLVDQLPAKLPRSQRQV